MYEGQTPDQVRILPIEPPEALAETLGYGGQARLVAFYWGAGDEAYYHDGHLSRQAEWDAYLLFLHHPLIASELQGYNLGSNEEEATHWLLLDRDDRQIAVVLAKMAHQQLLAQWGTPMQEQVLVVDHEAGASSLPRSQPELYASARSKLWRICLSTSGVYKNSRPG
jgi:hypothetical protein